MVGQVSSAVCSQSLQLCELLPLLLGEVSSQGSRSQRGRIEVGHPHQTFSSSQRLMSSGKQGSASATVQVKGLQEPRKLCIAGRLDEKSKNGWCGSEPERRQLAAPGNLLQACNVSLY